MAKKLIRLYYTSDVHGRLVSEHDILTKKERLGLSRVATFFHQCKHPYLYLDNGDILQGSSLLDVSRTLDIPNPAATALNALGCDFYTLGNHDFNYGFDYLQAFINQNKATLLLANVHTPKGPLGQPSVIIEQGGIRIGLIGVTTAYIPNWEKPEHIPGLTFTSAAEAVQKEVQIIRSNVDVVIVLYHGGIERDLSTNEPVGRPSLENEGVAIRSIPGVDAVLMGHQHMAIEEQTDPVVLQPGFEGMYLGELVIEKEAGGVTVSASLLRNDLEADPDFESLFAPLQAKTKEYLSQIIGYTNQDFRADSPLSLRTAKHPLVSWIHQLQRHHSNADISVVSLPNDVRGFTKDISIRDIRNTFVYDNTLVLLEMTGAQLRRAIEQTAAYLSLNQGEIVVSPAFLSPKIEHYNYDMYEGIEYTLDLRKPVGQRLHAAIVQGNPLQDQQTYRVVVNNYRAAGGGDYPMFMEAKVLQTWDVTLFDLALEALKENPTLSVELKESFTLLR